MTALFHKFLFNFNRTSKETMVISLPDYNHGVLLFFIFHLFFKLRSATKALSLNVGHKTSCIFLKSLGNLVN